jgi:branched-chain amino acid transport system permease protein
MDTEVKEADADRQELVHQDWDRKQRARIRALITDDLIDEHRRKPLGQHSDDLERVLQYFRTRPVGGKYVGVMTQPWVEYRIGVLPGVRGQVATILDDEVFSTEEEVLHGIFLRRVRDLAKGE